jgi:hypothetical protein
MKILLVCALAAAVLYGIHRLLLYCESRGWIYYWHKQGSPGTRASALLELHAMLEPQKKHMLTIQKEEHKEEDGDSGPKQP